MWCQWKELAGARDLLWRVVAYEVDGVLPRLPPHVHAWTHVDSTTHAVGGGPDNLQTTRRAHEHNGLHKNPSATSMIERRAATQIASWYVSWLSWRSQGHDIRTVLSILL